MFLPSLWGIFIAITQLLAYFWIVDIINFNNLTFPSSLPTTLMINSGKRVRSGI